MSDKPKIFRQSALDRLSSPERLDSLMQVTKPKGWLALMALGIIIIVAAIWSVIGRIPETLNGRGIYLKRGGVYAIQAPGHGVLLDVLVDVGDTVAKGGIIGHVAQPELIEEIINAQHRVRTLEEHESQTLEYLSNNTNLTVKGIRARDALLREKIRSTNEHVAFLEKRVAQRREARTLGLITAEDLQNTIQQLAEARAELKNLSSQISDLEVQEGTTRSSAADRLFDLRQQLTQARETLDDLNLRLDQTSAVRSSHSGSIVELSVDAGATIASGQGIALLAIDDEPLMAYLFIPKGSSKVQKGMKVQLEADAAQAEEYGYMKGEVVFITPQPISREGMMTLLHNDLLVQDFSKEGNPRMIQVALNADPNTPSGYAWTSQRGPEMTFHPGMRLNARIIVKEERPIDLVIPALKYRLGF